MVFGAYVVVNFWQFGNACSRVATNCYFVRDPLDLAVVAAAAQRVAASGRTAIRLTGHDGAGSACEAWAWARVRVRAPALVTTRAIGEGEPPAGAVAVSEREVLPGRAPMAALPDGAVAARALAAPSPLAIAGASRTPSQISGTSTSGHSGPLAPAMVADAIAPTTSRAIHEPIQSESIVSVWFVTGG
jgi:hypothetical protein